MQKPTYTIYGKEGCVFCVKAKTFLDRKGFTYGYIDIGEEDNEDALHFVKEILQARTVPQIMKSDGQVTYVGGFEELVKDVAHFETSKEG